MKIKKLLYVFLTVTLLLGALMYTTAMVTSQPEGKTILSILQPCEPPPPLRTWNAFYKCRPTSMILEPLFWYSRGEGKFYPWLAESYTEEEGPELIKITIKLRKGIKWSDGKEFTALDVLTTYWIRGWVLKWWPIQKYVPRIEAPDKYTVILYVKKPAPIVYKWWFLAGPRIVSYAQYGQFAPGLKVPGEIPLKDVDVDELRDKLLKYRPDKLIGTGPYVYKTFTDTFWVYVKRDTYWVKELGVTWKIKTPKGEFEFGGTKDYRLWDEIIWYRRISDPASWPMIKAGKFDYTWTGVSEDVYLTMKRNPNYWVATGSWLHGHCLYFNSRRYPLNITKVRWAIAYAINLQEYCKVAVEWGPESVIPAEWPVCISPPDVYRWLSKDWLAQWANKYEYNPDKAAELLEELGFTKKDGWWYLPTGEKFSLTVHVPAGWAGWVPGAENIAVQLRKFGIDAKVIELDWGMWGRTIREEGDFWLAIDFWTYGWYNPVNSYIRFYRDYTVNVKGLGFSPIQYVPEGVSKYSGMVNATELSLKLLVTTDEKEQKELVKALAYITNHYLPALQLHEKKFCQNINIKHIDCAIGWEVYIDYKPIHVEMGNNPGFVYGFLMCSGLWRAPPPPAPVIPKGLYATVNATYKLLQDLEKQVAALRGAVNSLTTAIIIEGIIIIILAIAIVLVIRKKAPPG